MEGAESHGQGGHTFGIGLTMTKTDPQQFRPGSSGWTGGRPREKDNGLVKALLGRLQKAWLPVQVLPLTTRMTQRHC